MNHESLLALALILFFIACVAHFVLYSILRVKSVRCLLGWHNDWGELRIIDGVTRHVTACYRCGRIAEDTGKPKVRNRKPPFRNPSGAAPSPEHDDYLPCPLEPIAAGCGWYCTSCKRNVEVYGVCMNPGRKAARPYE